MLIGYHTYEECANRSGLLMNQLDQLGYIYYDCEQNEYGSWDIFASDEPL